MGRWAECLSQTRNFAKVRFSEIQRRDRTIIFIARIALRIRDHAALTCGSRFAVSFCCFNKNENLYGGKEMLYTKV